jgi:hypothetical protein
MAIVARPDPASPVMRDERFQSQSPDDLERYRGFSLCGRPDSPFAKWWLGSA